MRDENGASEGSGNGTAPALPSAPGWAGVGKIRWRIAAAEMRVPQGVWRASVQARVDAVLVIIRTVAGVLPAGALAALTAAAGEAWRAAELERAHPAALDELRGFALAVAVMPRAIKERHPR